MFRSRLHSVILLWNPKTGSQSVHRYLRLNVPDAEFGPDGPVEKAPFAHWHKHLGAVVNYYGIPRNSLFEYRIGTWWRDPIDRCLSGFAWHQREFPDIYGSMSLTQYIEEEHCFALQMRYLTDRRHLDVEPEFAELNLNWEWFNFHDYDNEFRRLASWFGLTPGEQAAPGFPTVKNEIPHAQKSNNRLQIEDLTEAEIRLIKEYYLVDYELLESRGIFAPTRDL